MSLENNSLTPKVHLSDLYQEVILDHNKNPRNYKRLDACTHHCFGRNPLCGDSFEVFLNMDKDTVQECAFWGQGCAISKSSASIMTTLVQGKNRSQIKDLVTAVTSVLTDESCTELSRQQSGRMKIFEGVKNYPIRVKCAMLIWRALESALQKEDGTQVVSTED